MNPTLVADLVNVIMDAGTLYLGPELKVIGITGMTNAIEQAIISGAKLTPEALTLLKTVSSGNVAAEISSGLSLFGDAFTVALKTMPFLSKLALGADVVFNAVGDVASAGGLEETNLLIGGSMLAIDSAKLVYDLSTT